MHSSLLTQGKLFISKMKNSNYACEEIKDMDITPISGEEVSNVFSVALIDKSDECSYVTMARNAQNAGSQMVLIINNDNSNIDNIQVSDDGTGGDISIPTGLISKKDGYIIKNYMLKNPNKLILCNIQIEINKSDNVEVYFYLNVANEESFNLLKDFKKYYLLIKNSITFYPVYNVYHLENLDENEIEKNCVSNGRYCLNTYLPNNFNVKGKDLVLDSLYHQCIFKTLTKNNKSENFFDFANEYYKYCLFKDKYINYCGNNIFKKIGINKDEIMECIYNSFGTNKVEVETIDKNDNFLSNENILLYSNKQKEIVNNIKTIPSILINKFPFKDRLTAHNVFTSICSSFNTKPAGCYKILKSKLKDKSSINSSFLFVILLILFFMNVIIFLVCRKYLIKKVEDRVVLKDIDLDTKINSVVNSYLVLREASMNSKK